MPALPNNRYVEFFDISLTDESITVVLRERGKPDELDFQFRFAMPPQEQRPDLLEAMNLIQACTYRPHGVHASGKRLVLSYQKHVPAGKFAVETETEVLKMATWRLLDRIALVCSERSAQFMRDPQTHLIVARPSQLASAHSR